MRNLTTFHIIVTILVYIIDRKHRRSNGTAPSEKIQDSVRDTLLEHYKKIRVHPVIPLVLLCVPIYMMLTNNAQLLEQTAIMYIMVMLVRSVQIVLNKDRRLLIEYTNPVVTLVLLMLSSFFFSKCGVQSDLMMSRKNSKR